MFNKRIEATKAITIKKAASAEQLPEPSVPVFQVGKPSNIGIFDVTSFKKNVISPKIREVGFDVPASINPSGKR